MPHPHFMHLPRVDVNSIAGFKGLFLRPLVLRICDCERTAADQVGGEAVVGVGWVVCVAVHQKSDKGQHILLI